MLNNIWKDFVASIASNPEDQSFVKSFVQHLSPVELKEGSIIVSCPSAGLKFFILKKLPELEEKLTHFMGQPTTLEIIVKEIPKAEVKNNPLLAFEPTIDDNLKRAGLSDKYGFENFAVSGSNQVAYAAAQAVSERPGKVYNPFVLYGGVGVGKTHLAKAIAKQMLEKKPNKKVLFSPGDLFTNELIESIREKSPQKFRKKYRHLDLLIIDDVQFIAGKNTVQEEFFHTFNSIVSHGGQVILTSDRPPSAIKNLEDRLRSRFSGGLTVDIQAPDFELRTAILLIKAREKGVEIDIDMAKLIAEHVVECRELEGVLLSIYAKTLGTGHQIDYETIESYFSGEKDKSKKISKITPQDVIKTIANHYNIRPSHIKGPQRHEGVALPRQIAMFILRREFKLKYEEIAHLLKRKDHTTVMHGEDKIASLITKNNTFKEEIDRITKSLGL